MPVVPACVPKFTIRPPCTTKDDGKPTESISKDIQRVFLLVEDERHLVASDLLDSVRNRIAEFEQKYGVIPNESIDQHSSKNAKISSGTGKKIMPTPKKEKSAKVISALPKMTKLEKLKYEEELKEFIHVKNYITMKRDVIHKLECRSKLFRTAQQNLNENDDWIYASNHFGITTFYRHESDGSLSVKLDGEMDGVPLFEQLCVLKEVDLHYKWSPFCTSSLTIADLDKLDLVGWFMIGLPGFGICRDGCFRAVGCDNTSEDGSILLAGRGVQDKHVKSLPSKTSDPSLKQQEPIDDVEYNSFLYDDPIIQELDIPPVPTRRGSGRMTIRRFEGVIHVINTTKARTKLVANIDPNISFLPTVLLEFVMKHLAGVVLARLQSAAKKAVRHPVHNEHSRLMRTHERIFYHDWLLPKFEAICEKNGWEMPTVAAFSLTKAQLLEEQRFYDKHGLDIRRTPTSESSSNEDKSELTRYGDVRGINDNEKDLVSELSSLIGVDGSGSEDGSTWSSNPISKFLREQEEKIRRRKEAEVEAGRRRTVGFLKPKQLSLDQEKRLYELKIAKNKRLGLPPVDEDTRRNIPTLSFNMSSVEDGDESRILSNAVEKLSLSQKYTERLYSSGTKARVVSIILFVGLLFVLLHADLWVSMLSVTFHSNASLSVMLIEDVFIACYISFCSVVHFFLCDVALIYAFDSLELTSKTGYKMKKYYSDHVHFGMAIVSGGIVAISISKSLLSLGARLLLWWAMQSFHSILDIAYAYFNSVNDAIAIEQHFFGRIDEPTYFGWIEKHIKRLNDMIGVQLSAGVPSIRSWRYEAFAACRSLFSYTAVFLLVLLALFTVSARRSSSNLNKKKRARKDSLSRTVSSLSVDLGVSVEKNNDVLTVLPSGFIKRPSLQVSRGVGRQKLFQKQRSENSIFITSNEETIPEDTSVQRPRVRSLFKKVK